MKLAISKETNCFRHMENLPKSQAVSWLDYIAKEWPEENAQNDSGTPTRQVYLMVVLLFIYYVVITFILLF